MKDTPKILNILLSSPPWWDLFLLIFLNFPNIKNLELFNLYNVSWPKKVKLAWGIDIKMWFLFSSKLVSQVTADKLHITVFVFYSGECANLNYRFVLLGSQRRGWHTAKHRLRFIRPASNFTRTVEHLMKQKS